MEDDYVTCPYNSSHRILRHHFQVHLVRCEQANPHIRLKVCPLNTTHQFASEAELQQHLNVCDSRNILDRSLYIPEQNVVNAPSRTAPRSLVTNSNEENWNHLNEQTYNPQMYAQSAPVLRNAPLGTPSQRRIHRDDERRRISELRRSSNQNLESTEAHENPNRNNH